MKDIKNNIVRYGLINWKDLKPLQKNLKTLSLVNMEKLKKSIIDNNFSAPFFVWENKNNIYTIDGHQRKPVLLEMIKEGYSIPGKLPAVFIKANNKKEAIKILLGITSNYGKVSDQGLYELIETEGIDFEGIKDIIEFSDIDIDRFGVEFYEDINDDKEDDIPEDVKPITKKGDLWELGKHRLLCGDSTNEKQVLKLMNGEKADMIIADPPYNLGFKYNSYDDNKTYKEYRSFISMAFSNIKVSKKIITCGKQNLMLYFDLFTVTDIAIWYSKNKMSGGKISNLSLWEPIVFIGRFDRNARANDVFEYNNKTQIDTSDHTCPKTVDLFAELLKYSGKNSLIYDCFLGSGTTLIASEKTGRICYGMEIDEHYCDVIAKRYKDYCDRNNIKTIIKLNGILQK